MSIKYKVVERKNPQDQAAPAKYYAQTIIDGKDDTEVLARIIAKNTTMGFADIHGVLLALGEVVPERLAIGRSVDLVNLCILSPGMRSAGADTPEEFNANEYIKRTKVNIRAKKYLREIIEDVSVQRV